MSDIPLSLKESAISIVERLRVDDETALSSTPVGAELGAMLPNSPEHRVERFALSSFICGELIDDLVKRDGNGVEAFRFAPELDDDVVDVPSLAMWTQDIFREAATEKYGTDQMFTRALDRLYAIGVAPLTEISPLAMPAVRGLATMERIEAIVQNIGVSNFALDVDAAIRRGMWLADFYDMELPSPDQMPAYAKRSIAEAIRLSRRPQMVQDFYDTLEDVAHTMVPMPSTIDLPMRRTMFKDAAHITRTVWMDGNERRMIPGKRVAGTTPKSFYKLHEDDQTGIRVDILDENIMKVLNQETKADAIGCAVGLVKSESHGASALQLGLRATIRAMHELGVFDTNMYEFTEIAPFKTSGAFEFRGRSVNLGGSLLQTVAKIDRMFF